MFDSMWGAGTICYIDGCSSPSSALRIVDYSYSDSIRWRSVGDALVRRGFICLGFSLQDI